jgi:hypothetical protein
VLAFDPGEAGYLRELAEQTIAIDGGSAGL